MFSALTSFLAQAALLHSEEACARRGSPGLPPQRTPARGHHRVHPGGRQSPSCSPRGRQDARG
eukprot:4962547-Lingulodinium_polyedra.AAC.1